MRLVGEIEVLTWYQPPGILLNQQGILSFTVTTADTLACDGGLRTIAVSTMAERELVCSTSQSACLIEIITTSDGEQYYSIPLSTDSLTITSVPLNNSNVIHARRGETVVLMASGQAVRWVDALDNTVLSTNMTFNFTPIRTQTRIRVEPTSGICLAPNSVLILTEQDTAPPRITVRDSTIGCRDSFPFIFPIVTDDTDPNPSVTYTDSIVQLQPCGDRLFRTWTATDASGKTASATQIITRIDRNPPVITLKNPRLVLLNFHNGDTLTVDCQHIPLLNVFDVTVTDDCDSTPSISFVDLARQFGHCTVDGYIVLMECEWRAVDKCGNVSTLKIFIKVVDNDVPRFVHLPEDITVNNLSEVPTVSTVYGIDNCDDDVSVVFKEKNHGDTLIIRTWIIMDDCGHTATGVQYITIRNRNVIPRDTIPPQYQANNANLRSRRSGDTVSYNGCDYSFNINALSFSDNWDRNPMIRFDSTIQMGVCAVVGYSVLKHYSWTARDSSGNVTTFNIYLRLFDDIPPVLQGVPNDVIITSNDPFPLVPLVTATDNCSVPIVSLNSSESYQGQDTIYTRIWEAIDACGNLETAQQIITRRAIVIIPRDTTPPQYQLINDNLESRRSGDTVDYNGCDYAFDINDVSFSDNWDLNPTVRLDSTIQMGICLVDGYTALKTYTWIATDSSGNIAAFIIHLRISDAIPPILIGIPDNVDLTSDEPLPVEPIVTATDNCSTPNVSKNFEETYQGQDTIYTRTWVAVDACGNQTSAQQTITRHGIGIISPDTIPPQFQLVGRIIAGAFNGDTIYSSICDMALDIDNVYISDNRDANPTIQFDSTVTQGSCLVDGFVYLKSYHWHARDSTGNASDLRLYLRIVDYTPPQILNVPADITIASTDDLPPANVVSTDDCTHVDMTMDLSIIQNGNDTIFVRTWTSIDECGNTAISRQNIYKRGQIVSQSNGSVVEHIQMQLGENQIDTICFKNVNPDSTYTVVNICPDSTTSAATFTLLGSGTCVVVKGISAGVSKVCFQVCDNKGHCDTTYITVTISAKLALMPRVKEDFATTRKDKAFEIPVYQNDTLNGILKSFEIKFNPKNGVAATRSSGNQYFIVYTPKEGFCSSSSIDELVYEVCNPISCGQAMVHIGTLCEGLVVRNGFSPNGDGINDYFFLENLVDFPNTQVTIFNRWGNRVFASKDYKNDWKGDFRGSYLPDGTYFYQIVLENGQTLIGYLQIQK